MKQLLVTSIFVSLISCGVKQPLPNHPHDKIHLDVTNTDFEALDGNENLYAGLLCSSGERKYCNYVYDNISPSRVFCRNESRVTITGCSDIDDSFSRDELLGVMLFIVSNKDAKLANTFYSFIEQNNWMMCHNATDNRCNVLPTNFGIMKRVWDYVGLNPTNRMLISEPSVDLTILFASRNSPLGFETHLMAITLYLNQLMGFWNNILQESADALLRRNPDNLFHQYLATGTFSKDKFMTYYSERTIVQAEWAWKSDAALKRWKISCGLDFIFLRNLYNK